MLNGRFQILEFRLSIEQNLQSKIYNQNAITFPLPVSLPAFAED